MALCAAGRCRPLWSRRAGPGAAAAAAPRCRRALLQPRGAPSPLCCVSGGAGPRALLAVCAAGARRLAGNYERFLQRRWPRFYVLHATFTGGIQALFWEVKEIQKIKSKMSRQSLSFHQLPYREMERLRQFRRDLIKAIPIGIIAIPPFANFLVIILMYFFPRQLLIRHFWTPQQRIEFLDTYHALRSAAYADVLRSLALAEPRLRELCDKVQRGTRPHVAELSALRGLFSASPLALSGLQVAHARALSRVLFLTPLLPAPILRHRLRSHVLEIRQLDRALARLGTRELSEEELRAACYLRGLNSTHLSAGECRVWLEQWLGLSCRLQASELSLLANSLVLLSLNYPRARP